jgi:hypothetical protein
MAPAVFPRKTEGITESSLASMDSLKVSQTYRFFLLLRFKTEQRRTLAFLNFSNANLLGSPGLKYMLNL